MKLLTLKNNLLRGNMIDVLKIWIGWLFKASRAIFSYLANVTIAGDRVANLDICLAWLLAVMILLRATPAATQDLGLYNLVRRTGTHVPRWDLN
jgi:hypothetical protein